VVRGALLATPFSAHYLSLTCHFVFLWGECGVGLEWNRRTLAHPSPLSGRNEIPGLMNHPVMRYAVHIRLISCA